MSPATALSIAAVAPSVPVEVAALLVALEMIAVRTSGDGTGLFGFETKAFSFPRTVLGGSPSELFFSGGVAAAVLLAGPRLERFLEADLGVLAAGIPGAAEAAALARTEVGATATALLLLLLLLLDDR